ncbi:hypothetical protein DPMN_092725 [Dreissena polymorpha]|uniref:Uncharacterized protein n=1 Tax=Dreissena polymorpha TaxID=45954 RepID=A0A9D4L4H6_DREPO|nr:hypothetical protein DPMN_092725 [Dreissena polymorpha]
MYSPTDGPGTEQHKSSSFMSTATMEEDKLVHSTVSIEGQTLGGHTEEDGEGHTQQGERLVHISRVLKKLGIMHVRKVSSTQANQG